MKVKTIGSIKLGHSLVSDVNVFKTWDIDRKDYCTLDALITAFYDIYGVKRTIEYLYAGMPSHSTVRSRVMLLLGGLYTKDEILQEFERAKVKIREVNIYKAINCAELRKKLLVVSDNDPVISGLSCCKLMMIDRYAKEGGDLKRVAESIKAIPPEIGASNTVNWYRRFKQELLNRRGQDKPETKLSKKAQAEISAVKDKMCEYMRYRRSKLLKSPYELYVDCIRLMREYGVKEILCAFMSSDMRAITVTPVMVASMIVDPSNLEISTKKYMQKYFNGIALLSEASHINMQATARMFMSITDRELFCVMANTRLINANILGEVYNRCEMSEVQLAMELQALLNNGGVTIHRWPVLKDCLTRYPTRVTPLQIDPTVFDKFLPRTEIPYISKEQLQTVEEVLVKIRSTHVLGTEMRAYYDRVLAEIRTILQKQELEQEDEAEAETPRQEVRQKTIRQKTMEALARLIKKKSTKR